MRSRGLTLQAICDKLNAESLPTPPGRKNLEAHLPARRAAQSLIPRSLHTVQVTSTLDYARAWESLAEFGERAIRKPDVLGDEDYAAIAPGA